MQNFNVEDVIDRIRGLAKMCNSDACALYICVWPDSIFVNELSLVESDINMTYEQVCLVNKRLRELGAVPCQFMDDSFVFQDPRDFVTSFGRK